MRRRDEFAEVFGASGQIVTIERWPVLAIIRMDVACWSVFSLLPSALGVFKTRYGACDLGVLALIAARAVRLVTLHTERFSPRLAVI